jgi:hypothetical protein
MTANRTLIAGHLDIDRVRTDSVAGTDLLGGSALYTSVAASIHNPPVGVVSTICRDYPKPRFDEVAAGRLSPDLVSTLGTQRRNDMDYTAPTTGASDRISQGHSADDWQEKCELHAPRHVPSGYGSKTEILHLSPMLPRYQRLFAEWAAEREVTVSLDSSAYYAANHRDELMDLLRHVDLLLLSQVEVSHLLPDVTRTASARADHLLSMGPSVVVIRQGADGCLVSDDGGSRSFDALPATVVDPTGAGDSFNGGFVATYPDHSVIESCKAAVATAKYCIEGLGVGGLLDADRSDVDSAATEVVLSE